MLLYLHIFNLESHWEEQLRSVTHQQKIIEELQLQINEKSAPQQKPVIEQGGVTIVLPDGVAIDGDLNPSQVYAINVDAVVAIPN